MNPNRTIANRFTIRDPEADLLGRGGMGSVYRAVDAQSGGVVAVKVLNPQVLVRDPGILARFVREGEILRQLNHPNIVRLVAAVEEQGQHYLVMEYVDGGSLEALLKNQGSLPSKKVIEIMLDLADALTRAHRLGILHRDIKPANVLLAADGTPRLTDFGIASLVGSERLTESGALVGTIDYISPEVCQGEAPDERSDIWGLGVMLFEVLTGQLPFRGANLTATLTAILTQPTPDIHPLNSEVPDALADLLYRMLEKDPQQRIPSVRLVGAELEGLLKGRPAVTPSQPASGASHFETPTPTTQKQKHNLPQELTPFVGRQAELTEITRLLNDPAVRLLTLLGPGGMGKTRLGLEAGLNMLKNGDSQTFVQGVFFVGLAPLESVDAIVPAVASAVGFSFREGGEPRQQLLDYLAEKSMLLIFDNFEHLLSGANLVTDILQAAPRVKVLCTTRTRLDVPGEQLFQLEGLDFPAWETPADALAYSAVKLFLQSARRVRPGFELAAEDLKYIARICRMVGGMPLGILLAAAWVEMLLSQEIAAEMLRNLDFLESEQQSIPERQRSMRAVFDYTWKSLTAGEQRVFAAVSVFRGGFTREAAQEVTGASLRELMGLVNKSLLHRAPSGRYEIHQLLRQFGAEQLEQNPAEEPGVKDRHCSFYGGFLHEREELIRGRNQKRILVEIEAELENVQTGWDWAITQGRVNDIANSLECLGEFYRSRSLSMPGAQAAGRVIHLLTEVQDKPPDVLSRLVLARAVVWQVRFNLQLDADENPVNRMLESLAVFRELGSRQDEAYALCFLGQYTSLYDSAKESCLEGLAIFKELGNKSGIAFALFVLGRIYLEQEQDYPAAREYCRDSLELCRETGDTSGCDLALQGMGLVSIALGDYQAAGQYFQEELDLGRELGDQGVAFALEHIGLHKLALKQYEEAGSYFHQSLSLFRDIGDKRGMSLALVDLGNLANHFGNNEQAEQFARESLSTYTGVFMAHESFTLKVLGEACLAQGNLRQARQSFRQALQRVLAVKEMFSLFETLLGIARLRVAEGDLAGAITLLALVIHYTASEQMTKDEAAALLAKLEAELPPDVVAEAKEHGRTMDLDTVVTKLIEALGE